MLFQVHKLDHGEAVTVGSSRTCRLRLGFLCVIHNIKCSLVQRITFRVEPDLVGPFTIRTNLDFEYLSNSNFTQIIIEKIKPKSKACWLFFCIDEIIFLKFRKFRTVNESVVDDLTVHLASLQLQ